MGVVMIIIELQLLTQNFGTFANDINISNGIEIDYAIDKA